MSRLSSNDGYPDTQDSLAFLEDLEDMRRDRAELIPWRSNEVGLPSMYQAGLSVSEIIKAARAKIAAAKSRIEINKTSTHADEQCTVEPSVRSPHPGYLAAKEALRNHSK